ncbi:tetratricopeptide repeat protein [Bradyrhizobium sp. JYMT SZCCT0180]|uniref:tetratricopeptide repeat protein n=1 Tax=Bradyrhizobium sp. JYMT SZCCT0180 TaxID=2807666 RepID=UPI001BA9F22D|nr:sel1 repeat family protein [Bradyrhizobium sp. JYMT SZCCT0180]
MNLSRAARDKQAAIVATAARAAPIARRQLRLPMPIVRILLVLLALASPLSMAGGAVAGPFEDAQVAHSRRDYATALRLWRPLADQGNAEAQYALGFMYDGGQGVPKNYARAAKWWRLAADQGHTFAQYNLGTLYDNGNGVPQNKAEALKWYHLAAERGNDGAQFNVGVLHFAGVAVSENRIEAAKWFRRAADQGHLGAQVYLGLCYATGLGVPQDNIQAYMWLSLAAARSDQDAISNRNRVAQQMTPAQIAEAQKLAVEWKSKPER